MEEKRTNAGYTILQEARFGKKELVLGENLNNPASPYVTWLCSDRQEYTWGHYFNNYCKAMADWCDRVKETALEFEEKMLIHTAMNDSVLFCPDDCLPDSRQMDYTGQIVVAWPERLSAPHRHASQQLYLAQAGNGCRMEARGTGVFVRALADAEKLRFERHEIMGILRPECMPDWAKESLEKLHRLEKKEHAREGRDAR